MKPDLSQSNNKGQIIVIDDEPLILKLVTAIFEDEGYHVLTAETPELAASLIDKHGNSTSIFIVDFGLNKKSKPKNNVVELINERAPSKPILFISGSLLNDEEQELMTNELNAFLLKPFTITKLSETVARLISKK